MEFITLSIQPPSILYCLTNVESRRQKAQQDIPDVPVPSNTFQHPLDDPELLPGQMSYIISGLLPAGCASKQRHPGSIPNKCPNHLNWLLSMHRSNSSTPSSLWMTKLLILSWTLSPATLQRKFILVNCICDLILSVTTQSSWPNVKVGT